MKPLHLIIALAFTLLLTNCAQQIPMGYESSEEDKEQNIITHSLFDSKDKTISEADIQKILNGKIKLPDTLKVAVYKYASSSLNRYYTYYWNNEDFLKTQQSYFDTLAAQLSKESKVKKIILMPSIMVSKEPNINQLRESAVRLQADLLLIFSINSDIYYKYKAFQKNEAKAFATCEALIMDTRTGVIPHSSIITKEKLVVKEQEDWTNEETRKKAVNDAVILTLMETGKGITTFLGQN